MYLPGTANSSWGRYSHSSQNHADAETAQTVGYKTETNVPLYPTDLYHHTLPFAPACVYTMHDTIHAHLPCPPPLGNGRMRQINKMPIN